MPLIKQFLLILFSLCWLQACQSENGAISEQKAELSYEIKTITQLGGKDCVADKATSESLCARVALSYPVFSYTQPSEEQSKLLAAINGEVMKELLDFESEQGKRPQTAQGLADLFIADYTNQLTPFTGWDLERSVKVPFINQDLITLMFSETSYVGGAHPESGVTYHVLNAHTGDFVKLADLLSSGFEGELNTAGEASFRQAHNIGENTSLEDEGYLFENGVFLLNSNFAVLADGLGFYFNSYEIAPYAMGPTSITIPYEDITNLIPKQSPLTAIR